ncbi:MAG: hypothetical protein NZ518_02105 [Dehalococcoidia bacterium]|nr:hypothetical protein [Dehalococcoidia bacterium]
MTENPTPAPRMTPGFVPMGKPPVVTPLWPPATPAEPPAVVIEDPSVPLASAPEGLSDAETLNAFGAAETPAIAPSPTPLSATDPVAIPTGQAPADRAPEPAPAATDAPEDDPDRSPAVMAALRAGLLVDLTPTPDPFVPPAESSAPADLPVASDPAVTPAAVMEATTVRASPLRLGAAAQSSTDDTQSAIVLGRVIRSDSVYEAAAAGKTRLRALPDAYVTRSARRAMAVTGVVVIPDETLADARSPDRFRTALNPLEAGGAITRRGAGVMRTNGLPIGGDHLPGTLTVPPDPR